jgi:phosphoglycerol geranylgeranyltransferase
MSRLSLPLLASLEADRRAGRKRLAVLIDPDTLDDRRLPRLCENLRSSGVDLILFGGSLVGRMDLGLLVSYLRSHTGLPVVLFPGSVNQLVEEADALLFLSLISGRNPELLIGQHVQAAPRLQRMTLEVIATGYLLIDMGRPTAVQYMSGTQPIPALKPELAAYTALAGQYLGLHLIYADGGSGAAAPVPTAVIRAIRSQIDVPLIIGGGLRTPEDLQAAFHAGADVAVVGSAIEEDDSAELLIELVAATRETVSAAS